MDEHRGASYLYAVGSTDLGEDLQKFEYSASRIETRSRYASLDTLPQYTPEVQAELFARFERGEPLPEWTAENNPWHRLGSTPLRRRWRDAPCASCRGAAVGI
jgi:hypothetical protein